MSSPRVLLLDSPTATRASAAELLQGEGLAVLVTDDPAEARRRLAAGEVDLVVADIDLGGRAILGPQARSPRNVPLIWFEDFPLPGSDREALRREAFATLARPLADEQFLATVRRALERVHLEEENRRLRDEVEERHRLGSLVSRDSRMHRVFATVEAVADSSASLLIQGESGTGKTVLARAVHELSPRSRGPFVVVNCGAIPATLLESELFGHVRGAFTGAVRDRPGKFAAAHGGTLFLDEIATAPPELQVKLLRVLEEGRFEPVGDTRTREVDVRLIAATNVDLSDEVEAGRFRRDLYYRIHVVLVELPPLRERPGDVVLLAEHFLERHAARHGRPAPRLGAEAKAALVAHEWPGNVRELENTLERALLLAQGSTLLPKDLWPGAPPRMAPAAEPARLPWDDLPLGPLRELLEVPERWFIERALAACGGNRQETARTLGINRTTLFNKMKKYRLFEAEGPKNPSRPAA